MTSVLKRKGGRMQDPSSWKDALKRTRWGGD
jgi:hypothetical protein